MLMMRERETVEAGGLGSGGAFTIAASVKAFEVLSSNLYQNKTLAVIREITCNAVDAHTAASLPISGIKVHLPTYMEPVFWVRDYGSGLSDEDVLTLYTTYFRSTKDQDNSQIGGFGLGSKSPFAVADQFTVTSWHGGFKSTYACYKQDGMPQVNAVGKEPCGSQTGFEVRVPLTARSGSIIDWQNQARSLFCWWPETPTFNSDFELGALLFAGDDLMLTSDYDVDGAPGWAILRSLTRSRVIMGNVPYILDEDSIQGLPDPVRQLLRKVYVAIRAPMGSVSISPSRETLSYDAATNKYLVDKLVQIGREITAKLEKEISTSPSLAEARERVHGRGEHSLSHLFGRLKDIVKPRWNGKPVPETVSFKLDATFSLPAQAVDYARPGHRTTFRREPYGEGDVFEHAFPKHDSVERHILWTEKLAPSLLRKLTHNYHRGGRRIDMRLQVVSGISYAELANKCLEIGMPKPVNIDTDLEVPPAASSAGRRTASSKTQGYVFDPANLSYARTSTPIDLTGGGLYLEFQNGDPAPLQSLRALRSLCRMGFFTTTPMPRVIGLSKSNLDRLKNKTFLATLEKHGWVRFDAAWIQANVGKDFIEGHHRSGSILDWLRQPTTPSRKLLEACSWDDLQDLVKAVRPYLTLGMDYAKYENHLDLYAMMAGDQLSAKRRGLDAGARLETAWQKFLDKHPMLRYTDMSRAPTNVLNDYVNR